MKNGHIYGKLSKPASQGVDSEQEENNAKLVKPSFSSFYAQLLEIKKGNSMLQSNSTLLKYFSKRN